ncbi:MAG: hypothetical protein GXP55_16925 [Deltaproteobacteria bacterium]|nr:hypothetical protein [Deltaproteobacteria bacterium]
MSSVMRLVGAPRPVDLGVWLVVAILLGTSAAFGRISRPDSHPLDALEGNVHLSVPAGFSATEDQGTVIVQRPALGHISARLEIRRAPLPDGMDPALFRDLELTRIERARSASGIGYRTLEAGDEPAFGAEHSSFSRYAMVRDPPLSRAGDAVMPVVLTGMDSLVMNGSLAYHVSTQVEANDRAGSAELESLLRSLRIEP